MANTRKRAKGVGNRRVAKPLKAVRRQKARRRQKPTTVTPERPTDIVARVKFREELRAMIRAARELHQAPPPDKTADYFFGRLSALMDVSRALVNCAVWPDRYIFGPTEEP